MNMKECFPRVSGNFLALFMKVLILLLIGVF
jgi:hypothetical protein